MNTKQVIAKLATLGYVVAPTPDGKTAPGRMCRYMRGPDGMTGYFCPSDLLKELMEHDPITPDRNP